MRRVGLYGASGNIAPHIVPQLAKDYDLHLSDISPYPDGREIAHVDVTDYEQVLEAARGCDALMNFTVLRSVRDPAFSVNVTGAWNVMRAAVELGIKKIVHTGPQCIRGSFDHAFDVVDPPRAPGTSLYGLTKTMSYEICRTFARRYGIQTVTFVFNGLRPRPEGSETKSDFPPFTVIYEDLARACKLALEIESVPDHYQEFNMLSYEAHGKYSVDKARRILGFEPGERWEDYYKRPLE